MCPISVPLYSTLHFREAGKDLAVYHLGYTLPQSTVAAAAPHAPVTCTCSLCCCEQSRECGAQLRQPSLLDWLSLRSLAVLLALLCSLSLQASCLQPQPSLLPSCTACNEGSKAPVRTLKLSNMCNSWVEAKQVWSPSHLKHTPQLPARSLATSWLALSHKVVVCLEGCELWVVLVSFGGCLLRQCIQSDCHFTQEQKNTQRQKLLTRCESAGALPQFGRASNACTHQLPQPLCIHSSISIPFHCILPTHLCCVVSEVTVACFPLSVTHKKSVTLPQFHSEQQTHFLPTPHRPHN